MRIISGQLKGQVFSSPHSHTVHPMSEKIRGAIFTMLGDIAELTILDAFGGSGAVSFEAISRGAAHVVCIEQNKSAFHCIVENAKSLSISKGKLQVINSNTYSWIRQDNAIKFDLVIADPPYDQSQKELNRLGELIEQAKINGLFIISFPVEHRELTIQDESHKLDLIKIKNYGDAQLVFYRRIS